MKLGKARSLCKKPREEVASWLDFAQAASCAAASSAAATEAPWDRGIIESGKNGTAGCSQGCWAEASEVVRSSASSARRLVTVVLRPAAAVGLPSDRCGHWVHIPVARPLVVHVEGPWRPIQIASL